MKTNGFYFLLFIISLFLAGCTGSKKYFKSAEKLEKQGLMDEAAAYYMESLSRKASNTDARLKLKQVGQKYIDNLSSAFFREFSTQQYELSLETFDKLKEFAEKSAALNVVMNYPQSYADDYNKSLDYYLNKYYNEAVVQINIRRFDLALKSISKIKKYKIEFKNSAELEIISVCQPLYEAAILNIENKNYVSAKTNLEVINTTSTSYKDAKELSELVADILKTSFVIFQPKKPTEKDITEKLFNSFIEQSYQKKSKVKLITNTPFLEMPEANDIASAGNTDLIQAIRKATGADFFYVFDVLNKKEKTTIPSKGTSVCYEKIVTKKDTVYITEYKATSYNQIKSQKLYSYDFKYKLIDALTNQVITSKSESIVSNDNIDYYEFVKPPGQSTDKFFPYNPLQTPVFSQYNPSTWRVGFNNRKELKDISELKKVADDKVLGLFDYTLNNYLSK